jgi:RNA polymerase sigma-B factor
MVAGLVLADHRGMASVPPPSAASEALVHQHLGLARKLARRYSHPGDEALEDLEQVARMGLVKAARRFEPERGNSFAAYAVPTILGELRRYLRTARWPAHVPRRVQETVMRLTVVEQDFRAAHGRAPAAEEAARELGCSVEELLEARLADRSRAPVSIDARRGGGDDDESGLPIVECLGREDSGFEGAELRDALEQGLAQLDPASATAFLLRTGEELTLVEVAERMAIPLTRVSLLCRQALDELRAELEIAR